MDDSTLKRCLKHGPVEVDTLKPIWIKKGFAVDEEPEALYPEDSGEVLVEIKELERLEIALFPPGELATGSGSILVESLYPLPIGASLDARRGIFYWMPGAGFMGEYYFSFLVKDASGKVKQKNFRIGIHPKF